MKILIVTYDWPPRNSIGTHRPYSWAKYWSIQGVEVTILTSKKQKFDEPLNLDLINLNEVKVFEIEYGNNYIYNSNFFRILKIFKGFISKYLSFTYDPRVGWFKILENNLQNYAFDYDVVVSTYPPVASHLIAHKIKMLNPKILWVADYRDMWSISHLSKSSSSIKRKELDTVAKNADLITTVSNELAIELSNFLKRETNVITNGFDITELQLSNILDKNKNKNDVIKIVYTGMIYPGRRDPTSLISAIVNIEKKYGIKNKFELNFYGTSSDTIKSFINIDNKHFIKQCGFVSRDLAIKIQKEADFVLLLESEKDDAKGVLTGKLFEYIFSGTPIISIGSTEISAIWKVINSTKTGKCYVNDLNKLENDLLFYLENKKINWFQPNKNEILNYTRKKQAEILLALISNKSKII